MKDHHKMSQDRLEWQGFKYWIEFWLNSSNFWFIYH